jgi:hypothetical protein
MIEAGNQYGKNTVSPLPQWEGMKGRGIKIPIIPEYSAGWYHTRSFCQVRFIPKISWTGFTGLTRLLFLRT